MNIKKIIPAITALAITISVPSFMVEAQYLNGGPGIAIAGSADVSQLPDKAKSFMKKHFKDVGVRTCEQYFAKGKYEVELTNGIDLEFNTKGEIIEVDAPHCTVLPAALVKEILPHKAYSRLEKDGFVNNVESIEFDKGKVYEVELNISDPDTYVFNPEGIFIAIED